MSIDPFASGYNTISPDHYRLHLPDDPEVRDIIKSVLGEDGYKSFCVGNVLKYVLRHHKKGGDDDLRKAKQYLEWIV